MLQKIFHQFKVFSQENWWIYILLIISVLVIFFTEKGNIFEVLWIFSVNMTWNLFILSMQDSYKDWNYKIGASFLLLWNLMYFIIALYSWIFNQEYQYLLWQIWFQLTWIKAVLYYYKWYDIKWISTKTMLFLGLVLLSIVIKYLGLEMYQIIQSIGFAFVILGLVDILDERRFFLIFLGSICINIWSVLGLYNNFVAWNIYWITVSFTILGLITTFYYLKLLPVYLKRAKLF